MIDEKKLLEKGILVFSKPEGGCAVFSDAELSAIDTSAASAQPLTLAGCAAPASREQKEPAR